MRLITIDHAAGRLEKNNMKKNLLIIFLLILLTGAVGYIIFSSSDNNFEYVSYVQEKEEVYNMECGIIKNADTFHTGNNEQITYVFDDPKYTELIEKYELESIAGTGSEFDKAVNLMDYFSPRLMHNGNFSEYTADMDALYLLDYALGDQKHGIHCRAKAQIMNEEYLALGIYSRKMWINPLSEYDNECHVVNEIWDSNYKKWIMLDTTNNIYWVGTDKIPLSAIEVREKLAEQEFVTPVMPGEKLDNLENLRDEHMDLILYTAKNMAYLQYFTHYGRGEDKIVYALLPETMELTDRCLISVDSITAPPVSAE